MENTWTFIPGLELNEGFYRDIVGPLLAEHFPDLAYSASLIGYGSDVLGFDNPTSMDHNWGPRMQIFLLEQDHTGKAGAVGESLRQHLPFEYRGFPTHFTDPAYDHTQHMEPRKEYPVRHLIQIVTLPVYLKGYLGKDSVDGLSPQDWLTFMDQALLELTVGKVFHDGLGVLEPMRKTLAFYPKEIWVLRLASLWNGVCNEEPFIGRCRETGDRIGLKLIAGRLAALLVKICFYLEQRYVPYSKWTGSAFKRLRCFPEMEPLLGRILGENDPERIETALAVAYEAVVGLHNRTGDLPRIENKTRDFFDRPYRVIFAETIVSTLKAVITDESIRNTDLNRVGLDLHADSVDLTPRPK